MAERVLYTCPGHSFYVSTVLRDYFIAELGIDVQGYETMAFALPPNDSERVLLYEYASRSERRARHAHFVISKRLSRLHPAETHARVGAGADTRKETTP